MSTQPTQEVRAASSSPSPKTPWYAKWYLWVSIVAVLVVSIGAIAFVKAIDAPAADPGRPATTTAPSQPSANVPASPEAQTAAFLADSLVKQQMAASYGGIGGTLVPVNADDAKIVTRFNSLWQVGCTNPAHWQSYLNGILDVRSPLYTQYASQPPTNCAFLWDGVSSSGTGNPRTINLKLGSKPESDPSPYRFTFVPAAGRTDGLGVWLLSDTTSAPATTAEATMAGPQPGSIANQVTLYYGLADHQGANPQYNEDDLTVLSGINAVMANACEHRLDETYLAHVQGALDVDSAEYKAQTTGLPPVCGPYFQLNGISSGTTSQVAGINHPVLRLTAPVQTTPGATSYAQRQVTIMYIQDCDHKAMWLVTDRTAAGYPASCQ